ncbi:signal peptide peptidase SppA [Falsiroseomonas sp. HW251]|uniref:signal peptide peptidase SppA n=1 Tax=Falsiroseomonas sp. HW251 TaxID=3390998 RepID=UPI003D314C5D
MPLDADLLLDRRKLKRRLSLWRGLAVLAVAVLVLLAVPFRDQARGLLPGGGDHVARLTLGGIIGEDRKLLERLDQIGRDRHVRAVIVAIDSPGGTVSGGESLHAALRRVADRKPVVATMGGTAASAGYMVSLPAQRIFARESTVTGSIGVILQTVDASELLARLGVRGDALASGIFKDQPNPFHPLSEPAREQLMRVIRDLHDQFVSMVAEGRRMPPERARELADGRVWTGREALGLGLVDQIGGEAEARAWLAENRSVSADLPVRDIEMRSLTERTLRSVFQGALEVVFEQWLGVDRVRALWQPSSL